jgi:hypothetical protein
MSKFVKTLSALLFFAVPAYSACAQTTSAITADLANKCRQEAIKAHPTPKAGTKASGVEKAQRDAFQACVSKGADNKQN